jgi:dTDP-4-amino-4,6-dideoxygalactose transaminase
VAVDDVLLAAAHDAIASGWWSMGPRVERLEGAFAEMTGSRHAIAVANGTAALHLALLAVGCGPGDEVVLPSLNFVAAANAVVRVGAQPILCDVRGADDLNMDPADVERALTARTKAIVALHYGGYACDLAALGALARAHGLTLLEDAAHAPGATWAGRRLGTVGTVGCFSFFANKNLPVGEGGMLVTDDDEVAARLRSLRSHGMTTLTWQRHRGHAASYDVVDAGFNYRIDEIRAALALVQLERLADANAERREHATRYRRLLDGVDGLVYPFRGDEAHATSAHHLAVVVLPSGSDREGLRSALHAARIQTSVHYPPIHDFTAYASSGRALPVTDDVGARIVTLPLYPHMTSADVDLVAETLLQELAAQR